MSSSSNQPPPLVDYNLFEADAPLRESLEREGASWAQDLVTEVGRLAGTQEAIDWGFQANANPPVLRTHDRFGERIDEVDFHPAWHALLKVAVAHGLHALPWRESRPGAHAARAAAFYVWSQVEGGHGCPVSMTYAAIPTLRKNGGLAARWEPRATTLDYDPGLRPVDTKKGVLFGMAMTERQGGSDVRSNTTRAEPTGTDGGHLLTGHKWFCSAPMCDAFLVLAQAPGGLSCFLLPRVLPDGTRNRFHIQRLKDKLGNRSNASSEVELDGAWAVLVGEEGRGVRTIIDMVNHTRLDCVIGSASLMRQAVAQATHHTAHRSAFGRLLADQPLMVNVLADLAVESEATTILMMRLAGAFDRAASDQEETHFRRIGVAVAKFWTCKRAIAVVAEALECHGGNGYVEESILPRLYREAPLNSIWEGSGNVNALDVLRAMEREPESVAAYFAEVERAPHDARLQRAIADLKRELGDDADREARARRIVERMAVILQASLLLRHGDPNVGEIFCASRLEDDGLLMFGSLKTVPELKSVIERHRPRL
ncbi:MAG TPA: acyl-CoA dehydrogenase family protein [Candidatus Dormibacteraeota bacterium]|nr:acyl-CoA dehydrogenase family protein [Candidatus Dormibacteraeota bacterium]